MKVEFVQALVFREFRVQGEFFGVSISRNPKPIFIGFRGVFGLSICTFELLWVGVCFVQGFGRFS